MKVKTSVSLSDTVLCEIDREIGEHGNRSEFIERAVRRYFRLQRKDERDAHDAAIYAAHADRLKAETEELLDFAIDPFELGDDVELLIDDENANATG